MKRFVAILLAAMMLLSLAACGGSGDSGKPASGDGKYLNIMLGSNVMSLDTNLATDGDSFEVIADCIDGLTQMDAEGAAVPAIAESWDSPTTA